MSVVIGRSDDAPTDRPAGHIGSYRALDGSDGVSLYLDLDGPHAVLVVGKRGYGKSYTLGVVAEALAQTPPVAPVVVDPMGAFDGLADPATGDPVPADVLEQPAVDPGALDPRSWCGLVGLDPAGGPGGLLWRAAQRAGSLAGMTRVLDSIDATPRDRRAAQNHLALADSWGVFDSDGLDATRLGDPRVTVLALSGLGVAPMNAVVRAVGETLYRARVTGRMERLPWLLVDEAHTFFDGVAGPVLDRLLTRGRAPGVSLVLATQRPAAVPAAGISQTDLLCAHRLTARDDIAALRAARPSYVDSSLTERMPTQPGEVLLVDDATETAHAAQIRRRQTPHTGTSPRASRR
jgi:DNA helicase HerA-like ATPase